MNAVLKAMLFVCLSGMGYATDYVWTVGSGYWTNTALWGGGTYPGESSSADTAAWTNTTALTVTMSRPDFRLTLFVGCY